jgi:hypothetical protein
MSPITRLLFALVTAVVLFACAEPAPVHTSLSALTKAQLDFDGRQVVVSGMLRTFDSPRHYWIENEALDRVALKGAEGLASHVGHNVEVSGIFTYDPNAGRRIEVHELRTLP